MLRLRFWFAPIIIALALLSGFAMLYFGGILNPTTNLRHFPIAIVNLDTGPTGKTITDGLVTNMDKNQFDLRVLSADEARHQLDTGKVYAQLLLPEDLTQRLLALPQATLQPGTTGQAGHHDLDQPASQRDGRLHCREGDEQGDGDR